MVIIYLSVKDTPLESLQFVIQSSPTVVWVYRLRGLPRSIRIVSNPASSLWHFSGILGHSQSRSRFFRRHRKSVPRLIVSASTNTTSIAARASMDLPNTTIAVLDYPKSANYFRFLRISIKEGVNRYRRYLVVSQTPDVPSWIAALKYPY